MHYRGETQRRSTFGADQVQCVDQVQCADQVQCLNEISDQTFDALERAFPDQGLARIGARPSPCLMALRPKGLIAVRFGSLPKPPDLTYPLSS